MIEEDEVDGTYDIILATFVSHPMLWDSPGPYTRLVLRGQFGCLGDSNEGKFQQSSYGLQFGDLMDEEDATTFGEQFETELISPESALKLLEQLVTRKHAL